MTFSEFNRLANELARRYDPHAGVCIEVEHWTHRFKYDSEESRSTSYSATLSGSYEPFTCLSGKGPTPQAALDALAAQLAQRFPDVDPRDPLAEIDAEALPVGSEAVR